MEGSLKRKRDSAPALGEDVGAETSPGHAGIAAPQRGAGSGSRYSAEPDLHIVVEGKLFPVYSQVLMSSSPVFCQMLSTKILEASSGQIELPEKSADEFETFWKVLTFKVGVTEENCTFLGIWADEYQIDGVKNQCEDFLIRRPVTCAALDFATRYNMPRLEERCIETISTDIQGHLDELTMLGSKVSADTIKKLWPCICKAAHVDAPVPNDLTPGHASWPFLVKAIKVAPWFPSEMIDEIPSKVCSILPSQQFGGEMVDSKVRDLLLAKIKAVKAPSLLPLESIQDWPEEIFNVLRDFSNSRNTRYDERARDLLQAKVQECRSACK